jgi:acetyl esterase
MLSREMTARLSDFISLDHLHEMPVTEAREENDREAAIMFGDVDDVGSVDDRVVDGSVRVRVYEPEGIARGTLVFFHGGGWTVGGLASHDGACRFLCRHAGCTVVAVDHRLAPEHPYPAALEDAWAATQWAARELKKPLAIGGDSSGGNLAAAVAIWARDHGIDLSLQLLVYPALDLSSSGGLQGYWKSLYLGSNEEAANEPTASPLLAEHLAGLAPVLLLSCGLDSLWPQATRYESRLREEGVAVNHKVYPHLIHGAYRMPAVLPGALAMLEDSAAAVAMALGTN